MSKKRKRKYKLTRLGKITFTLLFIIILLIIAIIIVFNHLSTTPTNQEVVTPTSEVIATPTVIATIEPTVTPTPTYDTTDPQSLTVIANKKHSIGEYEPSDLVALTTNGANGQQYLRKEAADAFEAMVQAAANDGVSIYGLSGYRSYNTQVSLYQSYASRDGSAAADTYSSRAGYSDHQTGLAIDISGNNTRLNASTRSDCPIEQCEGSDASLWLIDNAQDYGFILRFPQDKQDITGYVYEWWHYRYVGVDLAKDIKASGLCMEEYFNIEGGDYNE